MMRNSIFKKQVYSLILIATFLSFSAQLGAVVQQPNSIEPNRLTLFIGCWETDSGSRYEFVNGEMICTSVHSKKFRGWVGKAALKNFHEKNGKWFADQAIRWPATGILSEWKVAEIQFIDQFSFMKTVLEKDGRKSECCKDQLWKKIK